jgi:hypothetical protein
MDMSEPRMKWLAVAAVICAGFLAYSNTLRNDFVWDDGSSILYNEHVENPGFFFQLYREDQHPFGRGQGNFYRPLLATSFMLDYQLAHKDAAADAARPGSGISPVIFHVNNILWHIAVALLLLALLRRFKAPAFVWFAVPVLYAVHPLHSEAVAYISSRADMMAAALMSAALWFSLWEGSPGRRIAGFALGALAFIAALLSKEAATIYPVLLAILVFTAPYEGNPSARRILMTRLPALILSAVILAVYGVLRMTVLHFASSNPPDSSFGGRIVEMLQAFALYLKLLVVPTGLHMERTLAGTPGWVALPGFLLLAGVIVLLVISIATKRYRAAAGLGWFLAAWLPISGLFPLNAPMAEHWMYVPLAGLLWAIAEYISEYARIPAVRWAMGAVIAAACFTFAGATAARNQDWRDNESIFRATLNENPNSIRVHYNLAVTYEDLLKNDAGARRHYARVIDLYKGIKSKNRSSSPERFWDDELESHVSLGRIYLKDEDYAAAAEHFQVPLQVRAEGQNKDLIAEAAAGLGQCLAAAGNYQRAGEFFKKAIELQPAIRSQIARSKVFASE